MSNPSSELVGDTMVFVHSMPQRYDQRMSVKHFRRKLRRHPVDAKVHGLLHVSGDRLLWVVKEWKALTLAHLLDDLKHHVGRHVIALNLTVTVDLEKQAQKARAGIDPKEALP